MSKMTIFSKAFFENLDTFIKEMGTPLISPYLDRYIQLLFELNIDFFILRVDFPWEFCLLRVTLVKRSYINIKIKNKMCQYNKEKIKRNFFWRKISLVLEIFREPKYLLNKIIVEFKDSATNNFSEYVYYFKTIV